MGHEDRARSLVRLRKVALLFGLLLVLATMLYVFHRGADVTALAGLGYPGVAILMFLSSSSIFLPAPGFAGVLAAGALWNPLLVGLAAGLGAATGELSGYVLGAGGGSMLDLREGSKWRRAHQWLESHGLLAVMLLAAVPNPLFDVLGVVAGSLSYPVRRFWMACVVGNCVKYTALAFLAGSATSWWSAP